MTDNDKKMLAYFREKLPVDQFGLPEECAQQPVVYDEIGEWVVEVKAKAKIAKEHVSYVEADLFSRIRKDPESFGMTGKITNDYISATIKVNPEYKDAFEEYVEADKLANEANVLLTSAEQRKSSIRDLVRLYCNNYYASNDQLNKDEWKDAEREIIAERDRKAEEEERRADNVEEE